MGKKSFHTKKKKKVLFKREQERGENTHTHTQKMISLLFDRNLSRQYSETSHNIKFRKWMINERQHTT